MFSSRPPDTEQRFDEIKAEIQQVRRQIEAVGRQVADAPVNQAVTPAVPVPSDIAERCQRLEERLEEIHEETQRMEARLLEHIESRLDELSEQLPGPHGAVGPPGGRRGENEVPSAGPPVEDEFDLGLSFASPTAVVRRAEPQPFVEPVRPSWAAVEQEPPPQAEPIQDIPAASLPEELERVVTQMRAEAPPELQAMLSSSSQAISDLAMSYRNASEMGVHGELELVLHLRVSRDEHDVATRLDAAYQAEKARLLPLLAESPTDLQQRLDTVVRRDIPALIDICDSSRLQFDPGLPFFMRLDSRIDRLLRACDLESIEPTHGQPYDPACHIALDLVESHDPSLKDHVESCRYRGYEWRGELLKKAGVVIYR